MKTLRNEKCRAELIGRLNTLSLESNPVWGRMSVDQMLSHLVQSGELPFESSVSDRSSLLSRNVIKYFVLYLLPIPKEVKTSADMDQQQDGRKPMGFEVDKANVIESIIKLGTLSADHECFHHPFFGTMSAKEWALIGYKHIDHHLRQFGA